VTVTNKETDSSVSHGRKPYTPPRLISYGHVKDIVQGATGPKGEQGGSKSCWVAEALYGVHDPRTLVLRAWLTQVHTAKRRGWWLVEVYRVLGPTVAGLVRRGAVPRRALLPLFDALAAKAFDHRARTITDERYRRPV
jgi:hypothetical protein